MPDRPAVPAPSDEHRYERKPMGYVGGDDDTPEWYAVCSCGWRGPLREDVAKPYEDHWQHLFEVDAHTFTLVHRDARPLVSDGKDAA